MNRPGSSQRLDAAEPQSIPVFVAAVSEPLIAVGCLLGASVWQGEPVGRAVMVLSILLLVLVFPGTNRFFERPLDAAVDIVSAWAIVLGILALAGFATDSFRYFDPAVLLGWALATPLAQFALVLGGRALMRVQASQPDTRRPALILGAGPVGAKVAKALRERRAYGHDVVGFLEDRAMERLHPATAAQVIGRFDQLGACIRSHRVKDVYITLPLSSQPRIARLLAALQDSAVSIYYVPDVFGVSVIQGRIRTLDGVPVVSLLESPFVGINALIKRASDLVLASLILLLVAPLMLAIAVAIRLDSPGPVIFRQRRNGLDGDEIVVYKFRSMHTQEDGRVVRQARRGDPRITRVGAFLRRSSLDELPQFLNVLQGRMSVVGPRPHAVAHNEQYRPIIRSYMVRHKVKPGITGWAQVNGFRGETEVIEKMAGRVAYDIDYLRNWSLGLDLRIIARTLRLVMFDRQAF
ncbi:MAG TPA: undecaprenyl-phosphate glucose phosphotransferase [Burkholderiaceae bacterium]|nr:undecaprenyl-phosphate glucose phosphotransferase [Burkholderiaceae bacterium]HMX10422.1 undecaprenyl-phosphate glucose phosphotransferase [Burkholderiaceae bacterium]HMY99821.1 undecaprenyl-phosphate glucose phosphotransferase [Burkholderiaceae bacterium]HNB45031.1 undecaprenyl-phosphate glucose phosphotransferase [Burkholderiaceae bacterium]HNG79917.1 undecaprenyl-phosphate glucose phosphotransferase [Burkholderiaceae bacterium]